MRKLWKELTVQDWLTEINRGLDYRFRYGLEEDWPAIERMVYHVHDSRLRGGPNIMLSTMDALLSTLNVPNPKMGVKPLNFMSIAGSRVVESVDNLLIRQMKMRRETERAVCAAYMWHRGFLKVGYDSQYGWAPEFDIGGERQPQGLTFTQFNRKGHRIEFGGAVPGMPWVEAVMPHDIVVPWGTQNLDTAPWIAHRIVRHIDDVRADVKYDQKAVRELMPVMSMQDFVESYQVGVKPYRVGQLELRNGGEGPSDVEYVELWEIHDRRTGKIIVIATGNEELFLRYEDDGLQVNGLPFVSINFVPNPRNFWSTSDAAVLKPSQAELTDIHIQATKQRRLSALRFLVQSGAISDDELKKAMSGDVGVAIKIKTGFRPADAMAAIQPGNNTMLYADGENIRRDAREAVGFSRNQMGEYEATGRRTAHEAAIVAQNAELRMGRRQQAVADLYIDTFEKVNPILFQYWNAPRVAQVTEPMRGQEWVEFTGTQLNGQYALEVTFEDEPIQTASSKKQEALMLLQAFAGDPRFDQIALARQVSNAYNDPGFDSVFAPGVLNGTPQLAIPQAGAPGAGGVQVGGGGARPAPAGAGGGKQRSLPAPGR